MSCCTFSLARNSPINTTLIDEATGQAVYEIDTSPRFSQYATEIWKLDSSPLSLLYPETQFVEVGDEMARIYWRFASDRIVFRRKTTTQKEFLPAVGLLRGSFAFTGPDGIRYRWALGCMGMNYPRLVTMDKKKTVIAEFHRKHYFTKKRKARLEVQPEGMHMLDYIILTFVLVEKKRREREAAITNTWKVW